jgi:acetyl-CoA C-acetyltransferase
MTQTFRRVAILGGSRIPFARHNTAYVDASNVQMYAAALDGLAARFGLVGQRVDEVVGGAVLKHSRDANVAREALLSSSLAADTPAYDVQQACATSLQASWNLCNKIATGQIDVGIAGGVDSASDAPVSLNERLRLLLLKLRRAKGGLARIKILAGIRPSMLIPAVPSVHEARTGLSMGEHCEIMVKQWSISREAQDQLALASHQNSARAYAEGFHEDLLTPFRGLVRDNNLRGDSTLEQLAALKPAFDKSSGRGTLTAGNSTPLTDGAACVLLASPAWAQDRGFTPLAYFVDAQSAAVRYFGPAPEGLLMAPAYAVPRLLQRHGLTLQDFDYYEIHEAFAGQVLCTLKAWEDPAYCRDQLGLSDALGAIDRSKLNVNGSSLGYGHPFAATGARIVAAAAKQLYLHRQRTGQSARCLISICAAGGLGTVAILEG